MTTLLVYEAAYTLGLGPVPLLNLSEFFPVSIRGKCASFATTVMWITHILTIVNVDKTISKSYVFIYISDIVINTDKEKLIFL